MYNTRLNETRFRETRKFESKAYTYIDVVLTSQECCQQACPDQLRLRFVLLDDIGGFPAMDEKASTRMSGRPSNAWHQSTLRHVDGGVGFTWSRQSDIATCTEQYKT